MSPLNEFGPTYSAANQPSWRALRRHDVKIVLVDYAPILRRIFAPTPRCPRHTIWDFGNDS